MTKAVNHIKYTQCSGEKCQTSINFKKVFELAKWGVFRGCWVEEVIMEEGSGRRDGGSVIIATGRAPLIDPRGGRGVERVHQSTRGRTAGTVHPRAA